MTDPLDKLPVFATDREIAVAIVGKERASMWVKTVIPQLERKGFPRIDPLHAGRPVPLVKKFYDGYFGITAGFAATAPDGEEDWSEWKKSRRRDSKKPQLELDGRCQNALIFMASHPDVSSHLAIPNASVHTMRVLVEKGALKPGKKDEQGDETWMVTDVGRDEAERLEIYYGRKNT